MASQTQAIVAATTSFLNSLAPEQRGKVQFSFSRQPTAIATHFKEGMSGNVTFTGEQYGDAMWSNFPVSDVPRPGLRLGHCGFRGPGNLADGYPSAPDNCGGLCALVAGL